MGKGEVAFWCTTIEDKILAKSFCDHIMTLQNENELQKESFFSHSEAQ
jgi:hypothetical protein